MIFDKRIQEVDFVLKLTHNITLNKVIEGFTVGIKEMHFNDTGSVK